MRGVRCRDGRAGTWRWPDPDATRPHCLGIKPKDPRPPVRVGATPRLLVVMQGPAHQASDLKNVFHLVADAWVGRSW